MRFREVLGFVFTPAETFELGYSDYDPVTGLTRCPACEVAVREIVAHLQARHEEELVRRLLDPEDPVVKRIRALGIELEETDDPYR